MDVKIRKEEPKDIDLIFALNKLVFSSDAEAKLVNNLRSSGSLFLSLVAIAEKQLIGHISFSPMKIHGFGRLALVGLAPMAVHPNLQRRGVGSQLIKEALGQLRGLNVDAVFLLGHKEYYPRFGFVPALSSFGIKSQYDVPDDSFMAMELKPKALHDVTGTVEYNEELNKL